MVSRALAESFTEQEQRNMMESLRSATRNTGFERWLDATLRPQPQADAPALPAGDSPKVPRHPSHLQHLYTLLNA